MKQNDKKEWAVGFTKRPYRKHWYPINFRIASAPLGGWNGDTFETREEAREMSRLAKKFFKKHFWKEIDCYGIIQRRAGSDDPWCPSL